MSKGQGTVDYSTTFLFVILLHDTIFKVVKTSYVY